MRVPRFYLDAPLQSGAEIALDEHAHRHAIQVLRLRVGDPVILFNGRPDPGGRLGEYPGTIIHAERRSSSVRLGEFLPVDRESPLSSTLVQGIAKGDRMDYSLQKAVELGVSAIQPVFCERTIGRMDARRLENRQAHWQGVVISACEQSGRAFIPTVASAVNLEVWLENHQGTGLVLDPRASRSLSGIPRPAGPLAVLIGPEGGLSETEIETAITHGITPVTLGPRVLRTETAAAATLTAVQMIWGDLDTTTEENPGSGTTT